MYLSFNMYKENIGHSTTSFNSLKQTVDKNFTKNNDKGKSKYYTSI